MLNKYNNLYSPLTLTMLEVAEPLTPPNAKARLQGLAQVRDGTLGTAGVLPHG